MLPWWWRCGLKRRPSRRIRKTRWAFHKAGWLAFAADCEQSLAELQSARVGAAAGCSTSHSERRQSGPSTVTSRRRSRNGARREGDNSSRERWIAAKRRAAELERKATITHLKNFVSTTLT